MLETDTPPTEAAGLVATTDGDVVGAAEGEYVVVGVTVLELFEALGLLDGVAPPSKLRLPVSRDLA